MRTIRAGSVIDDTVIDYPLSQIQAVGGILVNAATTGVAAYADIVKKYNARGIDPSPNGLPIWPAVPLTKTLAPIQGDPTVPAAFKALAAIVFLPDANYVLTPANYQGVAIRFQGMLSTPRIITFPSGDMTSTPFFLVTNNTNAALICGLHPGFGVTISNMSSRMIFFNGSEYVGA